jgi:hypothetical protein
MPGQPFSWFSQPHNLISKYCTVNSCDHGFRDDSLYGGQIDLEGYFG